MTFKEDTLPFKVATRDEYEAMENAELTTEQIISNLLSQADLTYRSGVDDRYSPRQDAMYRRGKYQQQFFVNYSFPKGSDTPVASLWTCKEFGEKSNFIPIHIDLAKLMDLIITHYKGMGYTVPPPKQD